MNVKKMEEEWEAVQVVVALKGHPGSGKSTLAGSIAAHLRCPLLDKDELYSAALPLFGHLPSSDADSLVNDLSYQSLWNLAAAQVRLGLSVVVDSPLSRRSSLDRLLQIAAAGAGAGAAPTVLVVECKPRDEGEWRRRLERRASSGQARWNQAATWQDLERMLQRYAGCYDYDTGDVPKLVVDTTNPNDQVLSEVLAFIRSHSAAPLPIPCFSTQFLASLLSQTGDHLIPNLEMAFSSEEEDEIKSKIIKSKIRALETLATCTSRGNSRTGKK